METGFNLNLRLMTMAKFGGLAIALAISIQASAEPNDQLGPHAKISTAVSSILYGACPVGDERQERRALTAAGCSSSSEVSPLSAANRTTVEELKAAIEKPPTSMNQLFGLLSREQKNIIDACDRPRLLEALSAEKFDGVKKDVTKKLKVLAELESKISEIEVQLRALTTVGHPEELATKREQLILAQSIRELILSSIPFSNRAPIQNLIRRLSGNQGLAQEPASDMLQSRGDKWIETQIERAYKKLDAQLEEDSKRLGQAAGSDGEGLTDEDRNVLARDTALLNRLTNGQSEPDQKALRGLACRADAAYGRGAGVVDGTTDVVTGLLSLAAGGAGLLTKGGQIAIWASRSNGIISARSAHAISGLAIAANLNAAKMHLDKCQSDQIHHRNISGSTPVGIATGNSASRNGLQCPQSSEIESVEHENCVLAAVFGVTAGLNAMSPFKALLQRLQGPGSTQALAAKEGSVIRPIEQRSRPEPIEMSRSTPRAGSGEPGSIRHIPDDAGEISGPASKPGTRSPQHDFALQAGIRAADQTPHGQFIVSAIQVNSRFPQSNAGIALGALDHLLKSDMQLTKMITDISHTDVLRAAHAMDRIHDSMKIPARSFLNAPAPGIMPVSADRLRLLLSAYQYQGLKLLTQTINMLEPGALQRHLIVNRQSLASFPTSPNGMIKYMSENLEGLLSQNPQLAQKVKQFGQTTSKILEDPEFLDLYKQYRLGLRGGRRPANPDAAAEQRAPQMSRLLRDLQPILTRHLQQNHPELDINAIQDWARSIN